MNIDKSWEGCGVVGAVGLNSTDSVVMKTFPSEIGIDCLFSTGLFRGWGYGFCYFAGGGTLIGTDGVTFVASKMSTMMCSCCLCCYPMYSTAFLSTLKIEATPSRAERS